MTLHKLAPWILATAVTIVAAAAFIARRESSQSVAPDLSTTSTTTLPARSFASVRIDARAAYVLDLQSGEVLFSKNETEPLPLASITKILSAVVAHEALPADAVITYAGERWPVDALLRYALVTSSNEAFETIARQVPGFVPRLNAKAREIGMSNAVFYNASGLDVSVDRGITNRASARDVAALFEYALKAIPGILDETRHGRAAVASLDGSHDIMNTDTVVDDIPWASASKTGFTDLAGGNLAVSYDAGPGRPIIIVVLGSSREGRFSDVQTLIDATL